VTLRYRVFGRVQGVGFRWFVARHARQLGICGYARNLADGAVEVVAIGSESAQASLEVLLRRGPAHADVSRVDKCEISDEVPDAMSFDIR
jgi:acylphosphatase